MMQKNDSDILSQNNKFFPQNQQAVFLELF